MNSLASLYPPLSQRQLFPRLYVPATFFLTLIPFLFSKHRFVAVLVFPILLALCIRAPYYTFGSPPGDYYNTSPFLAMPLWFLEFAILTSIEGRNAPVLIRDSHSAAGSSKGKKGQSWNDLSSTWERLVWAFNLMIPAHRGIGWNWQIKNIPEDPNSALPKGMYLRRHLRRMLLNYIRSTVMLSILGYSSTLQAKLSKDQLWMFTLLDVLIGWSGATWVWDRLSCFYSMLAAFTVAVGACEKWQWPPLMGNLQDAWSVRNMWGLVYHQTMRKLVQQPALRITRFLGLRKGSIGSRYLQLYISFGMSCLLHQFQMFNVTRKDMGEFVFFMSQPVAISAEDFVQWCWMKLEYRKQSKPGFSKLLGYTWVFLWFSFSLPIYVKGFRDANIAHDFLFGQRPLEFGSRLAILHQSK